MTGWLSFEVSVCRFGLQVAIPEIVEYLLKSRHLKPGGLWDGLLQQSKRTGRLRALEKIGAQISRTDAANSCIDAAKSRIEKTCVFGALPR